MKTLDWTIAGGELLAVDDDGDLFVVAERAGCWSASLNRTVSLATGSLAACIAAAEAQAKGAT